MQVRVLRRGVADAVHFRAAVGGFDVDAEEEFAVVVQDQREQRAEEHDVLEGGREVCGAVAALNCGAGGRHGGAEGGERDGEEGWGEGLEGG